jgi:hypothetical protein
MLMVNKKYIQKVLMPFMMADFVVDNQQFPENGNQECSVFGNKNAQLVSK